MLRGFKFRPLERDLEGRVLYNGPVNGSIRGCREQGYREKGFKGKMCAVGWYYLGKSFRVHGMVQVIDETGRLILRARDEGICLV